MVQKVFRQILVWHIQPWILHENNFHPLFLLPLQEGEKLSEENGMFFIETSAKTSLNINELFYEIGN